MNALKYALIFLAGAGIGFGASNLFFHKKYEKLTKEKDEELAKMDEYYRIKLEEATKKNIETMVDVMNEEAEDEPPVATEPVKEKRRGSFATDYAAFYATDPAETEHPRENEDEEPVREKQPPKLIRKGSFGSDGYATRVFYYYTDDDALIPEGGTYDDLVESGEVRDTLGNTLIKYGFADAENMEREIFVRNFDRKTDYHIIKIIGSLSDDFGG